MIKRVVMLLVVIIICLGLGARDVKAGPPWPAMVFKEDDQCGYGWANTELEEIFLIGDWHLIQQDKNGNVNLTCKGTVDFDDPEILSIDEVCELFPEWNFGCRGNGSFQWSGYWQCVYIDPQGGWHFSYEFTQVVTPSGHWQIACHFRNIYGD